MAGQSYITPHVLAALGLFTTTILAADVAYGDVIADRKSNYLSRYFRRLHRRQRECDEPGLADRVRVADVILTGTIRGLERDAQRQDVEVARVEVKRVFKHHHQVALHSRCRCFLTKTDNHRSNIRVARLL